MLRRSRAERLLLSQPPAWHLLRGWGTSAKRTVRVGPGPYDVAAGFGSIWVSDTTGVVRLNPTSAAVAARVRIPSDGEWSGVAVEGGGVWYLDSPGRLTRIHPDGLAVGATVRFGKMDGSEGFENLAATREGVCTARLGKGYGLACVQADHRPTMYRVGLPQGVKPVIGTGDGSIWVG